MAQGNAQSAVSGLLGWSQQGMNALNNGGLGSQQGIGLANLGLSITGKLKVRAKRLKPRGTWKKLRRCK